MTRKIVSYLLTSADGVVDSPDRFAREAVLGDIFPLIAETIADQDEVLLGRRTYDEWSGYWPTSDVEPFAAFINSVPKHVLSRSERSLNWSNAHLLPADLVGALSAMKRGPGRTIGVHGSIELVRHLLSLSLLDELHLVVLPALAGEGRRLLEGLETVAHLDHISTKQTPAGLLFVKYGVRGSGLAQPPREAGRENSRP